MIDDSTWPKYTSIDTSFGFAGFIPASRELCGETFTQQCRSLTPARTWLCVSGPQAHEAVHEGLSARETPRTAGGGTPFEEGSVWMFPDKANPSPATSVCWQAWAKTGVGAAGLSCLGPRSFPVPHSLEAESCARARACEWTCRMCLWCGRV